MLPIILFDITDITARAAAYEGYNDNVVETRPAADLPTERRGSPFTGLALSIAATNTGPRSVWSARLAARGQHYTPASGKLVGGDDGSVLLGWGADWQASRVTNVSIGQSVMVAGQNTARLTDTPMLTLDPSLGRQVFAVAMSEISWRRELTAQTATRVTFAGTFRYMLDETAPDAPGPGFDYAGPQVENEWSHALGPRDIGALRARVAYWYTARAVLDLSGRRGQTETWQVTPAAVWTHALSEAWQSELLGGLGFVTTTSDTSVVPAFSSQLSYSQEQEFALFSYRLGIDTASMSFGPGLSHALGIQYGAPLARTGTGGKVLAGISANASRASVPTSSSTSLIVTTAAGGVLLRYALGEWLGVLIGYEGQYLSMSQSGAEPPPGTSFRRNVAYIGLAGSVSTIEGTLPLDVPRAPTR